MPPAAPGEPPDPTSRLWWAVPAVSLILLALFAMLFGSRPESVGYGTSYDASGRGFRAAYLLLADLGYPVERSRRPSGGGVRWVLFPGEAGPKTADALRGWVRGGGRVLLATGDADFAARLGLQIAVNHPHQQPAPSLSGLDRPAAPAGRSRPAEAPDVTRLLAGETAVEGPPGGREWGRIDGEPLVTVHPLGEGEVWLLRRPDVLANANLRGGDNAVLACRLAEEMLRGRPGDRVLFDESCHGLRDRPDIATLLLTPPVLYLSLQALLLTGLTLWHFGARFGPVRPLPPPARRSKEEFLDAMADLLARKGDRADAFRTVRDDLRRRLEVALGLPAGTPPERIADEVARRRGLQTGPLIRILTADAPPDGRGEAAFLAALRQLEITAHECLPADALVELNAAARAEIAKVIVGQDEVVEQLLTALVAGGHVLIEGVPGTAKTLLVRVLARLFDCPFKRIQFTPDLMPADIVGTSVFDLRDQAFRFHCGPVFSHFVFGDEINRAPPKTQAALLEAMQEQQVTADGVSHPLPAVFTVFATQNPVEQEGTYPLPEAQLDRFMMKVLAAYPGEAEEADILRVHQHGGRADDLGRFDLRRVGGEPELLAAREEVRRRTLRDELFGYIVRVIRGTRENLKVEVGASPRAGLMVLAAAKARAALNGRPHVLPDDIKAVAKPVLRHRLVLKPGAEVDGFTPDDVLDEVLARTEIPR